ncbi:hypothetical protein TNCV_3728931 [Trichonephila clavipes]|nr:hypothetical protein TNCV_3728931 [Trichonephila clavipes]
MDPLKLKTCELWWNGPKFLMSNQYPQRQIPVAVIKDPVCSREISGISEKKNAKIGDMVIIKEDNLPSCQRSLGRINNIYPGKDSKVRVVEVKTTRVPVRPQTFSRGMSKVIWMGHKSNVTITFHPDNSGLSLGTHVAPPCVKATVDKTRKNPFNNTARYKNIKEEYNISSDGILDSNDVLSVNKWVEGLKNTERRFSYSSLQGPEHFDENLYPGMKAEDFLFL